MKDELKEYHGIIAGTEEDWEEPRRYEVALTEVARRVKVAKVSAAVDELLARVPKQRRVAKAAPSEQLRIAVGQSAGLPTGEDVNLKPDGLWVRDLVVRFNAAGDLVADLTVYLGSLDGHLACSFDQESTDAYGLGPGVCWVEFDSFMAREGQSEFINSLGDIDLKLSGTELLVPWKDFKLVAGGEDVVTVVVTLSRDIVQPEGLATSEDLNAALSRGCREAASKTTWRSKR